MAHWYYMEKDVEYDTWLKEYHERQLAQQVGSLSAVNNGQLSADVIDDGGATTTISQADAVVTSSMMTNALATMVTSITNDMSNDGGKY